MFDDPYYIEMYDFEHSVDEDRYIAIGKVGDVLFVVFAERKETIRLISAFCHCVGLIFRSDEIKEKLGRPVIDYNNGQVSYLEQSFDDTYIFTFEFLDDEFKNLQYFSIDG